MDTGRLAVFMLAAVAAGGCFYALAYPWLSGSARATKRQKLVVGAEPRRRAQRNEPPSRRVQVAESLKEIEDRQKKANTPPLSVRLERSGLGWTKQKYYVASVILAAALGILGLILMGPLLGLALAFFGGLAAPRWILSWIIKRRQTRFLEEFPNSIDVIVRGVRAGLPLGDCMRVVANDGQEPVRSEFRSIIETQAVGIPLTDAVQRMQDRLGLPEANFFAIVIAIQAKSGGSLSDALGNLSKVLRERKKMKAKIKAVSTEAKASAAIIGSLPPVVAGLVQLTSPGYISMLWTTSSGLLLLGLCLVWMGTGIMVMKKMINFDI